MNSSFSLEFGRSFLDGAASATRDTGVDNRCTISLDHSTMKPNLDGSFNIGGHSIMQSMLLGARYLYISQRNNTAFPELGNPVVMCARACSITSAEDIPLPRVVHGAAGITITLIGVAKS